MLRVSGIGNLTRDPELKETSNNCVCNYTIASNEYRKDADGNYVSTAHFVDCELWDSAAQNFVKRAKKGDNVVFAGKLRQNRWETQEGEKRSRLSVRVEEFQIIPKGGGAAISDEDEPETPDSTSNDVDDDEVPF